MADQRVAHLGVKDPLLYVARGLEHIALNNPHCTERKLYPHVACYIGIIQRAPGIPISMFSQWLRRPERSWQGEDNSVVEPAATDPCIDRNAGLSYCY